MPNISFDIFFDEDFINLTATRSNGAPKIKPAWKVRTAPKLPPKELPAPNKATARPIPKLAQRPRFQDVTDTEVVSKPDGIPPPKPAPGTVQTPKAKNAIPKTNKDIPKLPKKAETNGAPKAAAKPKAAPKPKDESE